jgi:FtsZ-interacting cell division protein YlmF
MNDDNTKHEKECSKYEDTSNKIKDSSTTQTKRCTSPVVTHRDAREKEKEKLVAYSNNGNKEVAITLLDPRKRQPSVLLLHQLPVAEL